MNQVKQSQQGKYDMTANTDVQHRPSVRKIINLAMNLPIDEEIQSEVISFNNLTDGLEHIAIACGPWRMKKYPLVRIHSECLTGDVFSSTRCDCGQQLHEALHAVNREGGIILYLRQEGRGIGLYNKLDSYELQSQGYDTYAANRMLNFPDDLRDYGCAAEMLRAMQIDRIDLLTNNPAKVDQLRAQRIEVRHQRPTRLYMNKHNRAYLRAKVQQGMHMLNLEERE